MTTYIVKRLLLMIPTFFAISLIIFVVLNFAPGRPGGSQISAQGTQTTQSAEARESYRIFKEQFNFDKPVLFNTRFELDRADVLDEVRTLADFHRPSCDDGKNTPEGCIATADKPPASQVIEAQDRVEDWGEYIVPQLLDIAETSDRLDIRIRAINRLSANAKLRLINEYGKNQTPEQRAENKKRSAENEELDGWKLPPDASEADIEKILDDHWEPWFEAHRDRFTYDFGDKVSIFFLDTRFAKYWGNLLHFDFGVSHIDKQPVIDKIMRKVPYTLTINFLAIFLAYVISIPIGVWSAYNQGKISDQIVTVVLFMLYSLPTFFVGVLLLEWTTSGDPFSWFPTGGFVGELPAWTGVQVQSSDQLTVLQYLLSVGWHLVLPVFCLTYGALASLSRYARTGLLDVIRADYIRTARAKGFVEPMVIIKHAVRNGMIPILTLLGTLLPALISGSVVIEFIFNIPGMGLYIYESIFARDYNAIMGVLLISSLLTLVGLLISDISYAIVDPRISFD